MTVAPQTNADLPAVARFLLEHDDYVICGHVSPDGDCLGSQLALVCALRAAGKRAACVLAKDDEVDPLYAFMPGAGQLVNAAAFEGPCATFVGVDVPTRERIGDAAALLDRAEASLTIDHHAMDTTMCDMVYVDPDAAAAAVIVWEVAALMGIERSGDIAQCCYVGVATDTGSFQYQNTDARALRAAAEMVEAGADVEQVSREIFMSRTPSAVLLEGRVVGRMSFFGPEDAFVISWAKRCDFEELGASREDAETLVDALRAVKGVRVACILREQDGSVRGSLRAKDDTDVSQVARVFGGGGHRAAAGFTLHCPMDEALAMVREQVVLLCGAEAEK